jgi:ribosomal protein S18 acetylase RimI-like enzyme
MTAAPRQPRTISTGLEGTSESPVRVPLELRIEAAARLIGDAAGAKSAAARRMLAIAAAQNIDLSLMWGVGPRNEGGQLTGIRQACLLVPGSGHTAMLLVSQPIAGETANPAQHAAERVACIRAACEAARAPSWGRAKINLFQALPDPQEYWAADAFTAAGFRSVGDLSYMRRGLERIDPRDAEQTWPAGVVVRNVQGVRPGEADRDRVIAALDRSYIDTLDCPELCGLRATGDVLDSHRSTGHFDPAFWWLVLLEGEPHGCMFFSHAPELASVELVYLGLSPALRGRGVASLLMRMGMARVAQLPVEQITCAVDLRNGPALRLYERLGFERSGRRTAMVLQATRS